MDIITYAIAAKYADKLGQRIDGDISSLSTVVQEIAESISEEYNPELTYVQGALVRHEGKLYRSNVVITIPEPWTPEHWDEVDLEDEITALKQDLALHKADNTIHVTSEEKENWDAKYDKPSGGIPKTDLSSGVQASLEKADSALQEHQSLAAYRTAAAQDTIDNGKQPAISDLASIRSGASAGATAYQKPTTGIPKTDLDSGVQESLDKADTAVRYVSQVLTDAQKEQARNNIGAFALTYDDNLEVIKITNQGETLGDVRTILNSVNNAGRHVMFDVSALGAAMYLCTIFIDDNSYTIFDAASGRFSDGAYDSTKLLTICLANANRVATQNQIDNLQEQIDELGGREVIKDLEALGNLIMSGDSPDVISLGDKIDFNFIKTVIGSTTHGNAVSCSDVALFMNGVDEAEASTYYFVYDGTNWTYKEAAIDLADFGLTVSGTVQTGEVMTVNTTIETENFTFTSYDTAVPESENVPHTWTMEATYAPTTKAYDTYEALFTLAAGKTLQAGNYSMTAPYYASSPMITVYFTIPTDFTAVGKKLQFASTGYQNVACIPGSETKYYIASAIRPAYIDSNVYEAAAITVKYNQDGEWTDISTVDGITCNPCHVQPALGDNCPAYCNLRQWLNDDSKSGNYHATEEFDRPSSYNFTEGYLHRLDPRVRRLIVPSKNKFTAGYQNGEYTQGQTYEVVDEVFLLSMKEMSFNIQTAEGTATGLYSAYTNNVLTNDAVPARAKYNKAGGTLNNYRWSRSAISSRAYSARGVSSSGSYDSNYAIYGNYVAPALNIGKSTQS